MEPNNTKGILRGLEKLLLFFGVLLTAIYASARIYSAISARLELNRFRQTQTDTSLDGTVENASEGKKDPDFRLWSEQRIAAFKATLSSALPAPLAVLRVPAIKLDVPVMEGTDDLTLNRAVGHIVGTTAPGGDGNVGIAGHRDGFFRVLKDIHRGDVIELLTKERSARYLVDEVLIVSPEDVSVLRPRSAPSLTLVTCYPFYFVGSAPQRYIVHAMIDDSPHNGAAKQKGSDKKPAKKEIP